MSECDKADIQGVFYRSQRKEAADCADEKGRATGWPHYVREVAEGLSTDTRMYGLGVYVCSAEAVGRSTEVARECYQSLQKINGSGQSTSRLMGLPSIPTFRLAEPDFGTTPEQMRGDAEVEDNKNLFRFFWALIGVGIAGTGIIFITMGANDSFSSAGFPEVADTAVLVSGSSIMALVPAAALRLELPEEVWDASLGISALGFSVGFGLLSAGFIDLGVVKDDYSYFYWGSGILLALGTLLLLGGSSAKIVEVVETVTNNESEEVAP